MRLRRQKPSQPERVSAVDLTRAWSRSRCLASGQVDDECLEVLQLGIDLAEGPTGVELDVGTERTDGVSPRGGHAVPLADPPRSAGRDYGLPVGPICRVAGVGGRELPRAIVYRNARLIGDAVSEEAMQKVSVEVGGGGDSGLAEPHEDHRAGEPIAVRPRWIYAPRLGRQAFLNLSDHLVPRGGRGAGRRRSAGRPRSGMLRRGCALLAACLG